MKLLHFKTWSWTIWLAVGYLLLATIAVLLIGAPRSLIAWYWVLSVVTWAVFGWDKWSAQQSRRRVPENTLHGLALLGGWPGAVVGQQQFRHKTQKQPFKALLWIAIVINIAAFVYCFTPAGSDMFREILGTLGIVHGTVNS